MDTKIMISVITIFAHTSFSFGQELSATKKIRIHDLSLQSGFFFGENNVATGDNFTTLAAESTVFSDLRSYNPDFYNSAYNVQFNYMSTALVGIQFNNKEKNGFLSNPILRLGLTYRDGNFFSGRFYRSETIPFDTLSSQNGGLCVVELFTSKVQNVDYRTKQIRFDASLLIGTNEKSRWSASSGIGFTAGFSVDAYTEIVYSHHESFNPLYLSSDAEELFVQENYQPQHYPDQNEKVKSKTNSAFSAFIPFTIDFRVGKKNEVLKKIHLFYEIRTGVNVTDIPELGTYTSFSVQNGLGIRYAMN